MRVYARRKVGFLHWDHAYTKDDTEYPVVMGHEIASRVSCHARERMSNGLVSKFGSKSLLFCHLVRILSLDPASFAIRRLGMNGYAQFL